MFESISVATLLHEDSCDGGWASASQEPGPAAWEQPAAPSPAHLTVLQAAPRKGPHRVLWELIK